MALTAHGGNGSLLRNWSLDRSLEDTEGFFLMVYILHSSLGGLRTAIIALIISKTITRSTESNLNTLRRAMYLIPASSKSIHLYSHQI